MHAPPACEPGSFLGMAEGHAYDPENLSILFDLFVAWQSSRKLLKEVFDTAEIRPDEYAVYSLILDQQAITPTGIADRLSLPVTTVLDQLRAMDQRGHIFRLDNPADGRSFLISLTPSGRRTHDATGELFDRVMVPLLRNLELPPRDVHAALRAIDAAARVALQEVAEDRVETN